MTPTSSWQLYKFHFLENFYPNFVLKRVFFELLMNTEQVPVLPFLAVNLESLAVEGGNAGGGLAVHGRQQHHCHQQQQQHSEQIRKVIRGGLGSTRQATAPLPPTAAAAS